MAIENLEQFVTQFSALLGEKPEWPRLLDSGRDMLAQLVGNPGWFRPTLSRLALDQAFADSQWQSIDPNAIDLFFSPDKAFLVRAFIWEPGAIYPIHDHGAWGLVGCHVNQVSERKFVRTDDGSDPDHAEVRPRASERILSPGETTFVAPLNEGIHQMKAANDRVAVTIHVYGPPQRKGFIQYFYPETNSVVRAYTPRVYKRMLAAKALGSIPEPWAEEVLTDALRSPERDYLSWEYRHSLEKVRAMRTDAS